MTATQNLSHTDTLFERDYEHLCSRLTIKPWKSYAGPDLICNILGAAWGSTLWQSGMAKA
jgi:hypothetical protein